MLKQCEKAYSKGRRNWAEKQGTTAEVQGNYANFKQDLAQKNFSNQMSTEASHCKANAILEPQGSKTWWVGIK